MRFQKSSLLVKLVIVAVIVCAITTLVSLQGQIREVSAANAEKNEKIQTIAQENEKLTAINKDLAQYQQHSKNQTATVTDVPDGEEADDGVARSAPAAEQADSAAMEELARQQGFVNPREIVFEDINN